jgi:hypothetical protein
MHANLDRWRIPTLVGLLFFSITVGGPPGVASQEAEYDVVLRGGRVFDGTGNPWVRADVAVIDGRIVAVGRLGDLRAEREIDVAGLYVMPGIIDVHSHANAGFDDEDPRARATINNLMQGITTVLIGENGSAWSRDSSIGEKAGEWSRNGIGTNAAMLVGSDSIRRQSGPDRGAGDALATDPPSRGIHEGHPGDDAAVRCGEPGVCLIEGVRVPRFDHVRVHDYVQDADRHVDHHDDESRPHNQSNATEVHGLAEELDAEVTQRWMSGPLTLTVGSPSAMSRIKVSSNRLLGGNAIGIETSYSPNQHQASYYYDPEEQSYPIEKGFYESFKIRMAV